MRRWWLTATVVALAAIGWAAAWRAVTFTSSIVGELERASALSSIAPRPQATIVFDRHGKQAFSYFVERRTSVPVDRVSQHMVNAIIAVEDRRFYSHFGIDPVRIVGAAFQNLRAGRIVEGGSTITQQLARAAQLSPVRTYERKIREVLVAARLEERYAKRQILEGVPQHRLFRRGLHGVERRRAVFRKVGGGSHPADAALLAALVRSPSFRRALRLACARHEVVATRAGADRVSGPAVRRGAARRRRDVGARRLATKHPAPLLSPRRDRQVSSGGSPPSAVQVVRRRPCPPRRAACYSTYDPDLSVSHGRSPRASTRLPPRERPPGRCKAASSRSSPLTGDVYALVGGRDFGESSFNRATQARRQAGSAFKPIIYAAALERGYAPGTLLTGLDTPIEGSESWMPNGDHERAEYTLRRALKVSSNRAAAQLLQQVGVTTALYYAQRLGIESRLPMVPSLALGTGEVTLLRADRGLQCIREQGLCGFATAVAARRGFRRNRDLERRRTSRPGDQRDHGVPDVEHAVRRRQLGQRSSRSHLRIHAAGGRQDGNHGRLRRRVVRRLYAAAADRRVVRARPARADHARRICGNGRRAGLGAFHERGDQGREARVVPHAVGRREGRESAG